MKKYGAMAAVSAILYLAVDRHNVLKGVSQTWYLICALIGECRTA